MARQEQRDSERERERQAGWDDKYLLGSYKMHPKATSGKLSGKCGLGACHVDAPHCDHYDAAHHHVDLVAGMCANNVCERHRERGSRKKCVACL